MAPTRPNRRRGTTESNDPTSRVTPRADGTGRCRVSGPSRASPQPVEHRLGRAGRVPPQVVPLARPDHHLDPGPGGRHPERVPVAVDHQGRQPGRAARRPGTAPAGPAGAAGRPARRRRRRPTARAVRQATRAPLDRPPTTSGDARVPGAAGPASTAVHASSRCPAGAGARRPATRYGWVTRATATPAATRGVPDREQVGRVHAAARAVPEHEHGCRRAGRQVDVDPAGPRGVSISSLCRTGPFCGRRQASRSPGTERRGPSPAGERGHVERRQLSGTRVSSRSRTGGPASSTASGSGCTSLAPGDQHRPPLAGRGAAPDAVAVARPPAPRPGRNPARRRCGRARRPRRPVRSAPERTSPGPRSGTSPLVRQASSSCRSRNGPQQSRIPPCGGNLVRAWHPRPCHPPTSPVGPARSVGVIRPVRIMPTAGAVFYRTERRAETRV